MTTSLTATAPKNLSPINITATWDSARELIAAAKKFEQCKLFCQVMLGFTIQALHKEHGVTHGGDRKSSSHDGNLIAWEDVLQKEVGLSQTTAYRYVDMAKASLPRLKKFPALRDFDPSSQAINALPEPQQKALTIAVQKITNGQTQKEFGESMGLWKKPQGSGAKGRKPGEGGRKKLTTAEHAELLRAKGAEDWRELDNSLLLYGPLFTALTDSEVTAQIATLEQHLSARRAWLKQPTNNRHVKAIEEMLS